MHIELKPPGPDLVEALPKWALKPELSEYFRSWPALQDWNRQDLIVQRLDWSYGIYEDGVLVGICQLYYPNLVSKTVEMGMLIDLDATKNRYDASDEAHRQMINYVFDKMEYQKVMMRVLDHRTKLIERLKAFGYKQEGHLIRSVKYEGKLRNEILLACYKKLSAVQSKVA
jgi:RimJ/RimL family protein N-acetyltransferase